MPESQFRTFEFPWPGERPTGEDRLLIVLYFVFKIIPMPIACFAIYLGYRLFILGVTGQASLSIKSQTISGQLLNAAPGLFFAVGGFAVLIASVLKGLKIKDREKSGFPHMRDRGTEMMYPAREREVAQERKTEDPLGRRL
jgi:hypothetical protein